MICLCIVESYSVEKIIENGFNNIVWFDIKALPVFFSIALFSQECIPVVFEIKDTFTIPHNFKSALKGIFIISSFLYIVVSILCNLGFSKDTQDLVLFNLPFSRFYCIAAQILYGVVLCISFPVQLVPLAYLLEKWLKLTVLQH